MRVSGVDHFHRDIGPLNGGDIARDNEKSSWKAKRKSKFLLIHGILLQFFKYFVSHLNFIKMYVSFQAIFESKNFILSNFLITYHVQANV